MDHPLVPQRKAAMQAVADSVAAIFYEENFDILYAYPIYF
jgi:hypothetical protein